MQKKGSTHFLKNETQSGRKNKFCFPDHLSSGNCSIRHRSHSRIKLFSGKGVHLGTIAFNGKGCAGASKSGATYQIITVYQAADQSASISISGTGGIDNPAGGVGGDFDGLVF